MSKSLIYTANTASTVAVVGSPIAVGSVVRKTGCGISAESSAFRLREVGYYDVSVNATFTAGVAGDVTITVYRDGVPVVGASATQTITTATTETRSINIVATVRVKCCLDDPTITIVASGTAPTITNLAVQIEKH